jgi:hypothetical protein
LAVPDQPNASRRAVGRIPRQGSHLILQPADRHPLFGEFGGGCAEFGPQAGGLAGGVLDAPISLGQPVGKETGVQAKGRGDRDRHHGQASSGSKQPAGGLG